jgi:cytochrome P450
MEGKNVDNQTADHPTIFHELLQTSDLPPEEKTLQHMVDEGQTVVAAGQVTTTYYLNTTTYHILSNPHILEKLKVELTKAMPNGTILLLQKLEQLPYLSAVIQEGYRISYGTTHRLQRVSPDAPLIFHEYVIPAGTPVGMTSIFMHENTKYFPEPKAFRPERWLNPGSRDRLEKYLVNFSRGTRGCLGQHLAQAEIYLTLAALIRKFEFDLYETVREDIDVAHDFFNPLPRKGSVGLRVIVKSG